MSEIKVGSTVQASDERFMRRVTSINGEYAICERISKDDPRRLRLSELQYHPPPRPITFDF